MVLETNNILRQLEKQEWQQTFDAMSDFVAILDRDFRIVKANRAMAEFLRLDDLSGRFCYEVMHGRNAPWPFCPHAKMLQTGRSVTEEIDDPHIGIPLLVTASPIFDKDGSLIGSVHIAKDISALKGAQAELESRNRELGILWSLSRSIRSLSFQDVIDAALEGVRSAVEPDLALFYLRVDDELVLRGHLPADAESLNEKKKGGDLFVWCRCRERTGGLFQGHSG